jgi:trimeric autotransporter adhesin
MFRLPWMVPAITLVAAQLSAQPCQPQWSDAFSSGMFVSGDVRALVQGTVGGLPHVFATGHFQVPARRIARWDGYSWKPFGIGLDGVPATYSVGGYALAIYDDGTGPALYVGGVFNNVDGISASHIARWGGNGWSPLGDPHEGMNDVVRALAVFDDGAGPALYAAGYFTIAGGIPAAGIARWRGSSHGWSSIGDLNLAGGAGAYALTVFDDGSGPALYIGGSFTGAAGIVSPRVVRHSASGWAAVGGGIGQPVVGQPVLTFAAATVGPGAPRLYAGGMHGPVPGSPALYRWDGSNWSQEQLFEGQFISALTVAGAGSAEPDLLVGGFLTGGTLWRLPLRPGTPSWTPDHPGFSVRSLQVLEGEPPTVAVAGSSPGGIARLSGGALEPWTPPRGLGGGGIAGQINALKWHDDGSGPALYAAGGFSTIGSITGQRVARWNGQHWSPVGTPSLSGTIETLDVYRSAGGTHLYAGGLVISNNSTGALARWDGQAWQNLVFTSGPVHTVRTLTLHGQRRLYVGGAFQLAGGTSMPGIFSWDGATMSPVGGGIYDASGAWVRAVTVFDGNSGPELHIAGRFTTAGNVLANSIARWDGAFWRPLGSGLRAGGGPGHIYALAVYGPSWQKRLYAAGILSEAGGQPVENIAAWNGTAWSALPTPAGFQFIDSLTVIDTQNGPRLMVGTPRYIWDGETFSPLTGGCVPRIFAAERVLQPGGATHLYLGGSFACFGSTNSAGLALQIGCPTCYANCDNSTIPPILNVEDFTCFINEFAAAQNLPHQQQLTHYANCDQSTTPPVLNVEDFTCFINRFAAGCP